MFLCFCVNIQLSFSHPICASLYLGIPRFACPLTVREVAAFLWLFYLFANVWILPDVKKEKAARKRFDWAVWTLLCEQATVACIPGMRGAVCWNNWCYTCNGLTEILVYVSMCKMCYILWLTTLFAIFRRHKNEMGFTPISHRRNGSWSPSSFSWTCLTRYCTKSYLP